MDDGLAAFGAAARSPALMLLPVADHLVGGAGRHVAEDVRMAPHDLGEDAPLDVREVEDAGLGAVLRVQHDLEQQVAELLGEAGVEPPSSAS